MLTRDMSKNRESIKRICSSQFLLSFLKVRKMPHKKRIKKMNKNLLERNL